jgi:hypothetical protein
MTSVCRRLPLEACVGLDRLPGRRSFVIAVLQPLAVNSYFRYSNDEVKQTDSFG